MNKLLVILGPTATGKTDLALALAKYLDGELISADSRQVYKGLDIGTGKLPNNNGQFKKRKNYWEINGIKIWMYDVTSPKRQYNVSRYVKEASKIILDIHKRGKLSILVGGTGLYIKALVDGLSSLSIPVNHKVRKKLEKLSKEQLQLKLKEISLDKWRSLNESDRQNPRRLVRSIELSLSSLRAQQNNLDMRLPRHFVPRNDVLRIGLTAPREILYQKVDKSLINRINQGMFEEAEKLKKHGIDFKRMKQLGLEYGILADYLEGNIKDKEELVIILQDKIHGYVRRQLTFFKKEKDVNWFDISSPDFLGKVENLVTKWYYPR